MGINVEEKLSSSTSTKQTLLKNKLIRKNIKKTILSPYKLFLKKLYCEPN